MPSLFKQLSPRLDSKLLKNSIWGLVGSLSQNLFLSLFYLFLARYYEVEVFAQYIIASTLYQFIVAFSAMGLGQWFIREVVTVQDKNTLIAKFMKMQTYFGIFFFLVNVVMALVLYQDFVVRILSVVFAINVIFDNIIYTIKYVNIANYAQKRTFIILSLEAFAKFLIAGLLFLYPFSIVTLSILLVLLRFVTLNLFLRIGTSDGVELQGFWKTSMTWGYIRSILKKYWPFAVIGSAYIIYWKMATLIISKMLTLHDVAHYENSFKVYSLAQLVPIIVSSTIFPKMVDLINAKNTRGLKVLYGKTFQFFMLYGIMAYTFTYSFADDLLPLAFGEKYLETPTYTKEMFMAILVFPVSLLQANVLVAMKLEKLDMWFNVNSVLVNSVLCLVGLYFVKSLSVVNYAIFISFIVFYLSQDIVLMKKGFISIGEVGRFVLISLVLVVSYVWLSGKMSPYILFITFWLLVLFLFLIAWRIKENRIQSKQNNI